MSSSNESIYIALYLYTAVIEFVYFTIIHLQNRGHKYAVDIAKHLKFFKPEVTIFVNTFSGKDIAEKCSNMLCTATPIFYSVNGNLTLFKDYKNFKQIIYEDFLISKSVDLILRGICDIQEICKALNLSHVIRVNKEVLISIFKQYPYFYLDKNSVIIIQFHGLLVFHDYTYEKVVQYFLSILQNTRVMSYNDVKFHSQFVPSCGIRSYLITFCILNASNIFKCRNSHIYITKKTKQFHFPSQTLNIKTLNEEQPISISTLVYQSHGSKLRNWTGEIYELLKNNGLISCVVDVHNDSQKIFFIYFHKTALKYLNEMRNLSEHLNIRDVVQFDAKFCVNVEKRSKCWHASRVSVIKASKQQMLQFNIDSDVYTGKMLQSYFLNPVFKYLSQIKCPFNFNFSQEKLVKENAILSQSQSFENIIDTFNMLLDKHFTKESSEIVLTNHTNLENKSISSNYSTNDVLNVSSSFPTHIKQQNSSISVDDQIFHLKKPEFNVLLKEKKEYTEILKNYFKDNEIMPKNKLVDQINHTFKKGYEIVNFITNQCTFLFGEVETVTRNDGIIICSFNKKSFSVYFQNKTLFTCDSGDIPGLILKHSKMLVAIPYFHEKELYHVANFVYLLNEKEIVFIVQEQLSAKDFIANYFVSKIKLAYCDMNCYCDINNIFKCDSSLELNSDETEEISSKCSDVVKSLKKICILEKKNFKCLWNWMILAQKRNISVRMPKMYLYMSSFLSFIFPVSNKQKLTKRFYKQNIFHIYAIKRNKYPFLRSLAKLVIYQNYKSYNSMNYDYSSNETSILNVNVSECNTLKKSVSQTDLFTKQCKHLLQVKQKHNSCSSLTSYTSCESVNSSDNVYYSCESTVNLSDLDFDTNNHSDTQLVKPLNLIPNSDGKNPLPVQNAQVIEDTENVSIEVKKAIISNFTFKIFSNSKDMAISNIGNIPKKSIFSKYRYKKRIPSLRSIPILKRNFIKNNKSITRRLIKICRYCSNESIEVTAYISVISNTCIYLNLKDNHNAFFSFPKKLIPENLLSNLKLNSNVNVTLIPNIIPHFSHVLKIDVDQTC